MSEKANILIITATKVESSAVLDAFKKATGKEATSQSIRSRVYFDFGMVNGARIFMTKCEMGSNSLGASQQAVAKGIDALKPSAVIMVGIAFGVDEEKQAIGEILVSQQLQLYDLQKVGTRQKKSNIILRGDKPHASTWLFNHFDSADQTWKGANVHFGLVLSGEKLVDNFDYREQLKGFGPEAIGGEMEGAGLYVSCQDKKVDWIVVKGICDWADGKKAEDKKERQKTAAENSVAFLLHALQFAAFDWESKEQKATTGNQTINNSGSGGNATGHSVAAGAGGVAVSGNVGTVIINSQASK